MHPFSHLTLQRRRAMNSLAQIYGGKLARWSIKTSIIVPGIFTNGTNEKDVVKQDLKDGPYKGCNEQVMKTISGSWPPSRRDEDLPDVAKAIVNVVDTSFGKSPFRVYVESMDLLW